MRNMGPVLLIAGGVLAAVGLALLFGPKVPWLGRLPGDIHYEGKNTSFHFPLASCVLLSIVLTVVLNLVLRWFRR